jgi:V/A-type H+-transporting ATPase subunit D
LAGTKRAMAKIKHTKNELKAQREALARYERFLPMLQLKKQQLQNEVQTITAQIAAKRAEQDAAHARIDPWSALFSEPAGLEEIIRLQSVEIDEGNVAGVAIPVLKEMRFEKRDIDWFATPPWIDDGAAAVEELTRLRVELDSLDEQRRRIAEELRVTSQRVNLFEKVKIPECQENIRVIKIFLGDEQTAGVARGKIAKRRGVARAATAEDSDP